MTAERSTTPAGPTPIIRGVLAAVLLLLAPAVSHAQEELNDPLEPLNRAIFWFNDQFDTYLFEPVARGYRAITPDPVETGISNFFENLRYPMYLVSDLVQLKLTQAGRHTGRFLINTTVGIGGLIDVAEDVGLERHYEDFGIALGYYGVPAGPYLVLPFLGPSNLRDGFGRLVDQFLDPVSYAHKPFKHHPHDMSEDAGFALRAALFALRGVSERAKLLDAVESAKEASLDYYLFVQAAYGQSRRELIHDGDVPGEDEFGEDLSDEELFGEELEDEPGEE